MNEFEKCLNERKIVKMNASKEVIYKEFENAMYDLARSKESLTKGDFKWASIQAYYSMFHCIKALIFKKGYREKSHYCLLVAFKELYVKTGEMDKEFADNFDVVLSTQQALAGQVNLSVYKESAIHIGKMIMKNQNRINR